MTGEFGPPGDSLRSVDLALSGRVSSSSDFHHCLSTLVRSLPLCFRESRSGKDTSDPESLSPALHFLLMTSWHLWRSEFVSLVTSFLIYCELRGLTDVNEERVKKSFTKKKVLSCVCWHGSVMVITVTSSGGRQSPSPCRHWSKASILQRNTNR